MFSFCYNLALLLLTLASLPQILWKWSKYKGSIAQRLSFSLPPFTKKGTTYWIHAVSVGETKAAAALYQEIKRQEPNATILISSTTRTGHLEAKESMPDAAAHFFLPLDFSWGIRRALRHFSPAVLFLTEGDFWYHLTKEAKGQGAKVFLVSGKLSERSAKRFQTLRFFSRPLFSQFDALCIQSPRHEERFLSIGVPAHRLFITGNLKLNTPLSLDPQEKETLSTQLKLSSTPVITIGSTHAKEEEALLCLAEIPHIKILLAPRHPERFTEVAALLERKGIAYGKYSNYAALTGEEKVILIDAMGKLSTCYALSTLAIVGGSFLPGVGGHNIFEPVALGTPVLFGPHMENQLDLQALILSAGAGLQLTTEELFKELPHLIQNRERLSTHCQTLLASTQGIAEKTFSTLKRTEKSTERKSVDSL